MFPGRSRINQPNVDTFFALFRKHQNKDGPSSATAVADGMQFARMLLLLPPRSVTLESFVFLAY